MGQSISKIKTTIPNNWKTIVGINYVTIEENAEIEQEVCDGIFYLLPNQIWPAHFHPEEEIYLFLSGSCTCRSGDEFFTVKEGDFVRIPGNAIVQWN